MPRSLIPAAVIAALAFAPRALADTSPQDRAAADALYTEAGKLAKENRWAEACSKLEASIKLDPGIGAMLHLADCYEKTGRNASAWSTLHDAYDLATKSGDKRAKDAEERASRIEPTLSKLLVVVAPEGQAAGVQVRRDGTVLSAGAWGTAVPVDPGDHVVEATQPGKPAWKKTVTVAARPGVTTVQVPALADAASAPASPEAPAPFWGAQRIAGVAVAGVGVAAVAVGAVAGGLAFAKKSGLAGDCQGSAPLRCDAAGVDRYGQAVTMANVSNVGLALGGAALATGAAVFFTAPKGGGGAAVGVGISGRW